MCKDCRENDVFSEQSVNMTRQFVIESKGEKGDPGEAPAPIKSNDLFSDNV